MPSSSSLDTIGDLTENHLLHAYCSKCSRSGQLIIDRLVSMYSARLTIKALKRRLTCSECGERSCEIRIGHNGRW